MSLDLGELVARVRVDAGGARTGMRDLDSTLKGQMKGWERDGATSGKKTGDAAGKGIASGVKSKMSGVTSEIKSALSPGKALREVGVGLIAGFAGAAVISKAVGYLKDATHAASDLNETQNKAQAIFGKQAGVMDKWAGGAAQNFGLSKQSALDYAAALGDMFTQLGNTGDQSAKMSQQVVKLAADLGSFSNMDTGDVLERIQAGFRGEYDSLQVLVPNINAARVQTEALTMTGKASATQLTAQEKAAATLAIITKDTSRAQGDFAKTSDQAANKAKINAARMEDLKAKIGQGLLPVYQAWLNLMSSVGIPALNGMVSAMGHLGTAAGPVIAGGKSLLDVFQGLPAPIKLVIGLLAAQAIAQRTLGSQFAAGKAQATGYVTSLQAISGVSRTVVTDANGMSRAYTGTAAKVAALGKSVPAIAKMQGAFLGAAASAERFPRAAGAAAAAATGMKSAAGGLVSAMGGPWGIALAAGAVALGLWAKKSQEAKAAAAESRARIDDLTGTLDKNTGAITSNTRAAVAKTLSDKGAFAAAKDLGIGLDDLTSAAMGQASAQKVVNDRLDEVTQGYKDAYAGAEDMSGGGQDLAKSMDTVRGAVGGSNKEVQAAIQRQKDMGVAMKSTSDTTAGAVKASDGYAAAQKRVADAQTKAKKAADDLKKGIDNVNNAFLEGQASSDSYQAAIDDATASLKENGKTLDGNTEKGRANREALRSIISTGLGYADSLAKQGASAQTVAAQVQATRTAYINAGMAMGYSRKEATALADKFAAMPKKVTTSLEADTAAAKAAVEAMGIDFASLPKSVQTHLIATGGKTVQSEFATTTAFATKIPTDVIVGISSPRAINTSRLLAGVTGAAQTADKQSVNVAVASPLAPSVTAALQKLEGVTVSADRKSVSIPTSSLTAGNTTRLLQILGGKADEVDRKHPSINTSTNAPAAQSKIQSALNAARDKTNTITTRHLDIYQQVAAAGGLHASATAHANGGLYLAPGVRRFANGGEDHQAQIARPGDWRVWAEPETGGEAYIPLGASKRARSLQILQSVAGQFGQTVTPHASGSVDKAAATAAVAGRRYYAPVTTARGFAANGQAQTIPGLSELATATTELATRPVVVQAVLDGRVIYESTVRENDSQLRKAGRGFARS